MNVLKGSCCRLATHFGKYVDVLAEFKRKYPRKSAGTAAEMAVELGVSVEKNAKGGSAACRAIAGVIKKLMDDGVSLTSEVTINDDEGSRSRSRSRGRRPRDVSRSVPPRCGGRARDRVWYLCTALALA